MIASRVSAVASTLLVAALLFLSPSLTDASFCTGGPHAINLVPGGKQSYSCSGTCYACLLHFETTVDPLVNHQYFINVLNGGSYIFEGTEVLVGPQDIGPALFGDATGNSALALEFECDAATPLGNCNGIQLSWGFVNCGCPDGQYVRSRCSGTRDAVCSTEPPPTTPICLSGETTVHVEHEPVPVPLQNLRVGDRVLTGDDTMPYQPVYMMAHMDRTASTKYRQIFTSRSGYNVSSIDSSSSPLEITDDHLVYVAGQRGPVRASSIRVGDRLVLHQGPDTHDPSPVALVTKIDQVVRKGLYAPLTPDGTIVVGDDGIVVSTYVAIQQQQSTSTAIPWLHQADLVHTWLSPVRLLCLGQWTETLCHSRNDEGLQHFVALGLHFGKWLEQQSYVVQVVLLLLSLLVTGPFRLIEMMLGPMYWNKIDEWGSTLVALVVPSAIVVVHAWFRLQRKVGFFGQGKHHGTKA